MDNQNVALTEAQLKILREIIGICSLLNCKLWLRGDWAIDFLLGRVSRPH